MCILRVNMVIMISLNTCTTVQFNFSKRPCNLKKINKKKPTTCQQKRDLNLSIIATIDADLFPLGFHSCIQKGIKVSKCQPTIINSICIIKNFFLEARYLYSLNYTLKWQKKIPE